MTDRNRKRIAVIGGGMAGLCAVIEAARTLRDSGAADGVEIILLDDNPRAGNKLYATGNGRCNVTNLVQTPDCYRTEDGSHVPWMYEPGWDREVIRFLCSIGVLTHDRNGYVYPRTDQASTVVHALIREAERLGTELRTLSAVTQCSRSRSGRGFELKVQDRKEAVRLREYSLSADCVILASGGKASMKETSPVQVSAGEEAGRKPDVLTGGYAIAAFLGHHVEPLRPSLCALLSDAPYLKMASGIRTAASVRLFAEPGCRTALSSPFAGELQMTDTGISGIPVFQISRFARKDSYAAIDFLPEISDVDWELECRSRLEHLDPRDTLGDFCLGLVPDRIAAWILHEAGLVREKKIANLPEESRKSTLRKILRLLRHKVIHITGTAGMEKAQVTAGGIRLSEITGEMESRLVPGLYFAGEILDVDGICGGYNLTWALHSGRLAGKAAARTVMNY